MNVLFELIAIFTLLVSFTNAKRKLVATSLVTCMEHSQLASNSFSVVFDPDDRSLHYKLDLTTTMSSYIYADIDVYAYGFKIITKNVDLCEIGWKQFCPVHPGDIQIEAIEYISEEYVEEIPGIAYTVPDIDAFAKVKIYSNTSEYLACLQVYFSNGKTVSQLGVKWATAVIAGLGLLLSALLSAFGNSTAASHISANTMSLFVYFQSVVVVAMEHVQRVPPIAASWAENLVWSMGLIRVTFMQKIFRWYIDNTGGTSSLYLTSKTMNVLTQKRDMWKRSTNDGVLYGNSNTLIFRGIRRLGHRMNIEETSIVVTSFTFFVLCGYVLAGFIILCRTLIELFMRAHWITPNHKKLYYYCQEFNNNWKIILKGSMLRYIYIGFAQLTIFSFWEFTVRDSPAVIVISCLMVMLACGLMIWASYRTVHFARESIKTYNNPVAILYGDDYVLNKYGFFYTMFNANSYWWNILLLSYVFVKSLFIGFAQASGQTQAMAVFILDLVYYILLIRYKPYLDTPTNIMIIFTQTIIVINSFLFLFFSGIFRQSYKVSAIMGWVFFIMNAAFSFILLLMILAFTMMIIFSKHPDLRFKPAKDDRKSFQRSKITYGKYGKLSPFDDKFAGDTTDEPIAKELLELGTVAKDHNANWETDVAIIETSESSNSNSKMSNSRSTRTRNPFTSSTSSGPLYEKESVNDAEINDYSNNMEQNGQTERKLSNKFLKQLPFKKSYKAELPSNTNTENNNHGTDNEDEYTDIRTESIIPSSF
ncbi:hypothetical protein KAFR_0A07010 [Kazachstania africana CBS 2517]|uniref:ML-like domain-containing protein n=1 Tax=Kazachstania africana (strain ATCC 22294 / BCRC 22015 / CBS 2517 / CECT 1963 / NBRC 1671 / NRRL Y-8276) TaxID=1071382 RepID=H2AP36_KAZAF|nr:hypothetical protein KAFR_0A07010 [Kazachstania africana CBS 2517]CCF56136.1 hypothetical protein KAFR_0A07010 [Kazachstania africana CBS 2517]